MEVVDPAIGDYDSDWGEGGLGRGCYRTLCIGELYPRSKDTDRFQDSSVPWFGSADKLSRGLGDDPPRGTSFLSELYKSINLRSTIWLST